MTSLSGETRFSRVGLVLETARRVRCRQELCEAVTPFQILRVDTNEVIQDCVVGYERAKKMTAYLRREFALDHDVLIFQPVKASKSRRRSQCLSHI